MLQANDQPQVEVDIVLHPEVLVILINDQGDEVHLRILPVHQPEAQVMLPEVAEVVIHHHHEVVEVITAEDQTSRTALQHQDTEVAHHLEAVEVDEVEEKCLRLTRHNSLIKILLNM